MQLDIFRKTLKQKSSDMQAYHPNLPMQMWQEDDQPASKLLLKGKAAVSDAELLSIIIGHIRSRDVSSLDRARQILHNSNESLGEISRLSVSDIMKSGRITRAQATRIISAFEIGRRRTFSEAACKVKVTSSKIAYEALRSCISDKPYEEFWILMLNRSNNLVGKQQISEGGVSGTVVDPKKIFKIALDHHSSGIILGHNHPSGVLTPSDADDRITKKLVNAGQMLEISVLDHIIIGDNGFYSFADEGKI